MCLRRDGAEGGERLTGSDLLMMSRGIPIGATRHLVSVVYSGTVMRRHRTIRLLLMLLIVVVLMVVDIVVIETRLMGRAYFIIGRQVGVERVSLLGGMGFVVLHVVVEILRLLDNGSARGYVIVVVVVVGSRHSVGGHVRIGGHRKNLVVDRQHRFFT